MSEIARSPRVLIAYDWNNTLAPSKLSERFVTFLGLDREDFDDDWKSHWATKVPLDLQTPQRRRAEKVRFLNSWVRIQRRTPITADELYEFGRVEETFQGAHQTMLDLRAEFADRRAHERVDIVSVVITNAMTPIVGATSLADPKRNGPVSRVYGQDVRFRRDPLSGEFVLVAPVGNASAETKPQRLYRAQKDFRVRPDCTLTVCNGWSDQWLIGANHQGNGLNLGVHELDERGLQDCGQLLALKTQGLVAEVVPALWEERALHQALRALAEDLAECVLDKSKTRSAPISQLPVDRRLPSQFLTLAGIAS